MLSVITQSLVVQCLSNSNLFLSLVWVDKLRRDLFPNWCHILITEEDNCSALFPFWHYLNELAKRKSYKG